MVYEGKCYQNCGWFPKLWLDEKCGEGLQIASCHCKFPWYAVIMDNYVYHNCIIYGQPMVNPPIPKPQKMLGRFTELFSTIKPYEGLTRPLVGVAVSRCMATISGAQDIMTMIITIINHD